MVQPGHTRAPGRETLLAWYGRHRWRRGAGVGGAIAALCMLAAGCASGGAARASGHGPPSTLQVVVAENFWGSIAKQEGGIRAHVTSVIVNPNADPHAYEPSVSDARLFAGARYVLLNGAGYDPWGQKLLSANPVSGRRVLVVGDLLGKKQGDNPHFWYSPAYVERVASQITADYIRLDPGHRQYYAREHQRFMNVSLGAYRREIAIIAGRYRGVPVGATESIFEYPARALRLNLTTPPGFMKALSGGTEPTAADKVTFDDQVTHRKIKVLVFNSQNSTPDIAALERKARSEHIPVVPITETLHPATASFEAWQVSQFDALRRALSSATGR